MKKVNGKVSGVKQFIRDKSHVANFMIRDQAIEISDSNSIVISNGDEVIVAGKQKRGLLHALAYRNCTNGVNNIRSIWPAKILSILFFIISFLLLFTAKTNSIIWAVILVFFSIIMWIYSSQYTQASKLVESNGSLPIKKIRKH